MNQALDLARIIQEPYSGAWGGVRICFPADTYPWQDPPPASFTLGPDHWVVIDATGTTVEFEGAQHHNGMAMGGAGLVFLPVLYTALDVSRPVEMRRHFVQSFMWRPEASAELLTWSLAWTLSEVVGADVKTLIGSPDLMTITASQPPASIDVSKMVQVRVNANGEAEWVRLTGSTPQSEVIPFKAAR